MAEQSEAEVLFPEKEVEGLTLRPWSFGQIADLAPIFRRVAADIVGSGALTVAELRSLSEVSPAEQADTLANILAIVLPVAPDVIAKTLRLPLAEVRDWPPERGTRVFFAILMQNVEHLKNWLGPVLRSQTKVASGSPGPSTP